MMLHHHVAAVKGAKRTRKTKALKKIKEQEVSGRLKAARLVVKQDIARNNTVWVTGLTHHDLGTDASFAGAAARPPKKQLEEHFQQFGTVVSITAHSRYTEGEESAEGEDGEAIPESEETWALVSFKDATAHSAAIKQAAMVIGMLFTDDNGDTHRLDVQDTKEMSGLDEEDLEQLTHMWREQKQKISCAVKIQAAIRGRKARMQLVETFVQTAGKGGGVQAAPFVSLQKPRQPSGNGLGGPGKGSRQQQGSTRFNLPVNAPNEPQDIGEWVDQNAGSQAEQPPIATRKAVEKPAAAGSAAAQPAAAAADRPISAEKQAGILAAQKKAMEMQKAHAANSAPPSRVSSAGTYQPPAARSTQTKTVIIIGDHEFVSTELNSELRVGRHKTFKLSGQRFASAARNVRAKPEGEGYENESGGGDGTGDGSSPPAVVYDMTKKDKEAAAAKERRRKKKMQVDMAPQGLTPEEVKVGMLVKVIGDLTAKGVVLEHRKTRLRVDFSGTGGPASKWIECNLKTLLFNLEPGKSEQITGAWARSDKYLGIVVEADDGEGGAKMRLGDGSYVTVEKESVKR